MERTVLKSAIEQLRTLRKESLPNDPKLPLSTIQQYMEMLLIAEKEMLKQVMEETWEAEKVTSVYDREKYIENKIYLWTK